VFAAWFQAWISNWGVVVDMMMIDKSERYTAACRFFAALDFGKCRPPHGRAKITGAP
jgi:hypothetical protein